MLKRIVFCAMMVGALTVSAASFHSMAQTEAEEPKPGSRAYTDMKIKAFKEQLPAYQEACDGGADLARLNAVRGVVINAHNIAWDALDDEVEARKDVRDAVDELNHAKLTYAALKKQGTDYVAELKAQAAVDKVYKNYLDLRAKNKAARSDEMDFGLDSPRPCPRHQTLLAAKQKADDEAAAAKKAAAAKTATGGGGNGGVKANCTPGTGLAGAMEGVACQEQHAGAK
jgi:hypothetical protein